MIGYNKEVGSSFTLLCSSDVTLQTLNLASLYSAATQKNNIKYNCLSQLPIGHVETTSVFISDVTDTPHIETQGCVYSEHTDRFKI